MPTIYVTNFANHRHLHGGGRLWSIMASTPEWAPAVGKVRAFTPDLRDLRDVQTGRLSFEAYRSRCVERFRVPPEATGPGRLMASTDSGPVAVRDGDTLCCTCAVAEARQGRCHRVWATAELVRAGWTVVLDGDLQVAVSPC
jgi:hypothetical protein